MQTSMNENREVLTRNECVSPKQMSVFILNLSQSQMYLENAKRTLFGLLWLRQIPRRRKQIDHDSHGCYAVYTLMFAKPLRRIEKKIYLRMQKKQKRRRKQTEFFEKQDTEICVCLKKTKIGSMKTKHFCGDEKNIALFVDVFHRLILHWFRTDSSSSHQQNENISFQ